MNPGDGPVHLHSEQVKHLDKQLADCRHNVNNSLSMIISALELLQFKPDTAERMIETAMAQTRKITQQLETYSAEFERTLRDAQSESTN